MAFIDYYKILGVKKDIPQKDVKRAYLKRAKQFHPDLHPDDPKAKAKFQALNEAYEVIKDPDKRAKYDQYGERWREAEAFGGAGQGSYGYGAGDGGFDFNAFTGGTGGFSSFFESLFGSHDFGAHNGSSSSFFTGNADIEARVDIDMYTALLGGDIMISLSDGSRIKIHVHPETQNGSKVRLRGKGNDRGNGMRGDLLITYNVVLPTRLTDRQRQLLAQMRGQ